MRWCRGAALGDFFFSLFFCLLISVFLILVFFLFLLSKQRRLSLFFLCLNLQVLGLSDEALNEGLVGEESVLVLRVAELLQDGHGVLLGDLVGCGEECG